ncbi:PLP-dependent aminotransferase family protein [bacterium]|nr:PLP-dependent aminotransferase family protein [bacterium]
MILIDINPKNKNPLYQQIIRQLAALIDSNSLRPGDRLPATRQLARQLGVHRSTVVRAYDELLALGYIHSQQGGYSTVRQKQKLATSSKQHSKTYFRWEEALSQSAKQTIDKIWTPGSINKNKHQLDFESFDLDQRMIPVETIRKSINHALCDEGADLLKYGPSAGYYPLRKLIARRLAVHAIKVLPEEILITHGAQHGMDLVLRLLTNTGDAITIEDPTYGLFLPLTAAHRLKVHGIPMLSTGMDLDVFEKLIHDQHIKLIYTMPNFHNPTGITTDQHHRERLLELCVKHNIVIIEDAFDEEMKYFGRVPLPIKSMDRQGNVIYLGTFSKVLSPGMRMGWIAAPTPCIDAMTYFRRALDLSSPLPLQAAITRILRRDDFEKHIQRLHRAFRQRMLAAIKTLRQNLPAQVQWTPPSGGYLIWLTLVDIPLTEHRIIAALNREGILVSPGSRFSVNSNPWPCFRISISQRDKDEIINGLKLLCNVLKQLYGIAPNKD